MLSWLLYLYCDSPLLEVWQMQYFATQRLSSLPACLTRGVKHVTRIHLAGGLASLFGTLWDYLENLYISNCAPVMRPDDLVHLACFSKLVRLNIDSLRGPVEARQINHLGRLTNLQELRILFAGHGLEQNLLVCDDCCCIYTAICWFLPHC